MHSERDGQIRATDEHDRQIKELRARLNDLDREYSELLSTKTTLHAEITSYQHLLDRAEIRYCQTRRRVFLEGRVLRFASSYGLVPLTRDLHEQWLSNQGEESHTLERKEHICASSTFRLRNMLVHTIRSSHANGADHLRSSLRCPSTNSNSSIQRSLDAT